MQYVPPKIWLPFLQFTHHYRRQLLRYSEFRRNKLNFDDSSDMNTSIETADLNSRSVYFSNIGICFFQIPLPFLVTLTDLDLSGTLIEALGLTIVSRWCTELWYLALRRCINLSNEALDCFSTGFGELLCLDLSEDNFLNKETLRRLLEASPVFTASIL